MWILFDTSHLANIRAFMVQNWLFGYGIVIKVNEIWKLGIFILVKT